MKALRRLAFVLVLGASAACGHYGPPIRGTSETPAVEAPSGKTTEPMAVDPECEEKEPS